MDKLKEEKEMNDEVFNEKFEFGMYEDVDMDHVDWKRVKCGMCGGDEIITINGIQERCPHCEGDGKVAESFEERIPAVIVGRKIVDTREDNDSANDRYRSLYAIASDGRQGKKKQTESVSIQYLVKWQSTVCAKWVPSENIHKKGEQS